MEPLSITIISCEPKVRKTHYFDVPEFITDIKPEVLKTEEPESTSCVQINEECILKDEEQCSAYEFSLDHVKTEPIEKEDNLDVCNVEQDEEASMPSDSVISEATITKTPRDSIFKCEKCTYETINKNSYDKHVWFSKHLWHECSLCSYKTPKMSNYKRHLISHKSLEDYLHKCLECRFQTSDEFAVYKHMAEHSLENNKSTCQQCDSGTFDSIFGSQVLPSEANALKECYYQKCKKESKVHVFSNESIKEVSIYKCNECKYQTNHKGNLNHHMRRHKDPNELEMFACTECPYQSFNKCHLQTHLLTHKNASEVTLYRCSQCKYHSKYKADLKVHILRHQNRADVPMFKCSECTYQVLRKCDLNRHMLRHKSAQDVKMHRCPECKYETFDRGNLNKHIYRHKMAGKGSVK